MHPLQSPNERYTIPTFLVAALLDVPAHPCQTLSWESGAQPPETKFNQYPSQEGRAFAVEGADVVDFARRMFGFLAILGSGFTAALISHELLYAVESAGFLGSGYLRHAHASLSFVAPAAIAVLFIALALYVAHVIDVTTRRGIVDLARWFGRIPVALTMAMVACTAVVSLAAMEASEGSFARAFGSVPLVGIAIVVAVALCIGTGLRAIARWFASATAFIATIVLTRLRRFFSAARRYEHRSFEAVCAVRNAALRLYGPNRAPPSVLA